MPPKKNNVGRSRGISLDNLPFDTSNLSEENLLMLNVLIYTVNNNRKEMINELKGKPYALLIDESTELQNCFAFV